MKNSMHKYKVGDFCHGMHLVALKYVVIRLNYGLKAFLYTTYLH